MLHTVSNKIIELISASLFLKLTGQLKLLGLRKKYLQAQLNRELCFVTFNLNFKPVSTIHKCIKNDENNHLTFGVNGKTV